MCGTRVPKQFMNRNDKKGKTPDTSPYVHKKKAKFSGDFKINELPWTEKQKEFIKLGLDKKTNIVLVNGPAGTSKTILSVYCALKKLMEGRSKEIIYTRVPVESCDYGIGYIKGDQANKMAPYIEPCVDKLRELLASPQITALINDERVIGVPLGFMRGLNLTGTVIFDEAQNATVDNMLLVMSRMANFSTLYILGDTQQQDTKKSGFLKVFNSFNNDDARAHGIHTFEFTKDDIVRSAFLHYIIEMFENLNKQGEWRPKA